MQYFLLVLYALIDFDEIFAGSFGYAMVTSVIFRGFDMIFDTIQNTFYDRETFSLRVLRVLELPEK